MRRLLAAVGLALLVAGCGLPLADGVESPGEVRAEQRGPRPISVLPPGPQPGATPEGVVLGFLAAQGSARDDHGVARSFLAPTARASWLDDVGVTVYEPRTATTAPPQPLGDGVLGVTLSVDVLGDIGADGAARVQPAQRRQLRYRLRQDAGQWRLTAVPDGLTLSSAARDRSFDPVSVYFLAPRATPTSPAHVAPDLLQLPADGDRAQQVVERLLAGPSTGLAGSVDSAAPPGARLRRPVATTAAGDVTVDLTGTGGALSPQARQDLSAQLVWTLRDALPEFTRLRLLVGGSPIEVTGQDDAQPRTAWSGYAPEGTTERPAGTALVGGELLSLAPDVDDRVAQVPSRVGVLDAAVDARSQRLAVLTGGEPRALRVGRAAGPLATVLNDEGLRSPSWGSGELGLWLLRTGARPAVLLVPPEPGAAPVEVQVDAMPALDDDAVLRVSRDGTRLALVAGGVLQVGRVELGGRRPHVLGLHRLATGVRDVAWLDGTVLQALVDDEEPPLLPLLRVSVDGTVSQFSGLVGVADGTPVAIAAFGEQPLLVETDTGDSSTVYAGSGPSGFEVRLRDASRPSYPR